MFRKLCCKNYVRRNRDIQLTMHCSTDASKYLLFAFSLLHFRKSYEKELLFATSCTTGILYMVLDCSLCINWWFCISDTLLAIYYSSHVNCWNLSVIRGLIGQCSLTAKASSQLLCWVSSLCSYCWEFPSSSFTINGSNKKCTLTEIEINRKDRPRG